MARGGRPYRSFRLEIERTEQPGVNFYDRSPRAVGRGDDRIRRRRIENEDKLATLAIENRRLRSAQDRRGSCEIMNVNDGSVEAEHAAGKPAFVEYRKKHAAHPMEDVGRKLRGLMPWMRANQAKPEPVEAGGTADHGFRMM